MKTFLNGALLFVIAVSLLSGCSADIKEEQKTTNQEVSQAFNSTPNKVNNKNKDIRFYLPIGFEINEVKPNNVLIKNGQKTYILFYNQQESPENQVVYDATVSTKKDLAFNKTYKKDKRFGFLLVQDLEKNLHEVTVGVGGVKMTTETKTGSMKTEAKAMMDIVNSVTIIKKAGKE